MKHSLYQLRWKVAASVFTLLLVAAAGLEGQMPSGGETNLRGKVVSNGLTALDGLRVELCGMSGSGLLPRTDVGADGRFEFQNVSPGSYELKVTGPLGGEITRTMVSAPSAMGEVTVRLPEPDPGAGPVSGTISAAGLRHKVPSEARKEFERSVKATEKQDVQGAIEHLHKAIGIDPDFMQAYNDLGARYLSLSQYEKALESFQKAGSLDPGSPLPFANASSILLRLKRYHEAEMSARRALQLDPVNLLAHYVLGVSLIAQDHYTPEALGHLRRAYDKFPEARLAAAQFLVHEGQNQEAQEELQDYLSSGETRNQDTVKAWLSQLETGD